MRVLVLGGSGMLGHKMAQVLGERHEVWTTRREWQPTGRTFALDVRDADRLAGVLDGVRPDAVVNCVGIIKQRPSDPVTMIETNAVLPHRLLQLCDRQGARLIHVSTDCVFSGVRGNYTEDDLPDATDLYGRSKLLGEVAGSALTIRTSIIGPERGTAYGLVAWLLANRSGKVVGYWNAIFSGLTTLALSRLVCRILREHPKLSGLWHVSAAPISKFGLLVLLREAYGLDIEVAPCDDARIDRSLDSSRFRAATGWAPDSWCRMVADMATDARRYYEAA